MKVAIDISPLANSNILQHRVRGSGFYIDNLKKGLTKYYPENKYLLFNRGEQLPSNIDLVHYPYFEPFFLTLPILNKFKTVITVHDLTPFVFPKYFPSGIKGKIKWQIQKMALKRADAIITDSESSKKDIIKYTGISEKKIHKIYLAAGEEFKKYQISNIKYQILKKKYNLPEKFALYVGDVTWNKNLPRLIAAVKKTDIPLVMVGKALIDEDFDKTNPWNQDQLKVQKMVSESRSIICTGFVPAEDLIMIYNIAKVFIMPSVYEGFGLPILEAMACGSPVITTKEGSLPEIAGDASYYIDAYSPDSIAKGIECVFRDEELRKKLIAKGFTQVKKFSWKLTAEKTVNVYRQMIH